MGNVQGYGSFNARNNENSSSSSNNNVDVDEKKKELIALLEKKKLENYNMLELYHYHINMGVQEQNFKLKNEEIIKQLDKQIQSQEKEIKELEDTYQSKLKEYKYEKEQIDYKKNMNEVLFYITLLCVMALIGVIFWAITKKN